VSAQAFDARQVYAVPGMELAVLERSELHLVERFSTLLHQPTVGNLEEIQSGHQPHAQNSGVADDQNVVLLHARRPGR
jgi:hypothetical protein